MTCKKTLEGFRAIQNGVNPSGKFEFLDCDKALSHIRNNKNVGTTELSEFIRKPVHVIRRVIKILEGEKLVTSKVVDVGRSKKLIISAVKGKL